MTMYLGEDVRSIIHDLHEHSTLTDHDSGW
jgi:hypothetical protein